MSDLGSSKEWNLPWKAEGFGIYDTKGTLVVHVGITGNRGYHGAQLERMASMIADAVNTYSAGEPPVRQCNHEAISPKGTLFYHGFVGAANHWRCDVCKGVYEGNLTDPTKEGSQLLTLVSSPPVADPSIEMICALGNPLQRASQPPRVGCAQCSNVAPIANVIVANGEFAGITMYAPGLPDGGHDLYPAASSPPPSPDLVADLCRMLEVMRHEVPHDEHRYAIDNLLERARPTKESAPDWRNQLGQYEASPTGDDDQ